MRLNNLQLLLAYAAVVCVVLAIIPLGSLAVVRWGSFVASVLLGSAFAISIYGVDPLKRLGRILKRNWVGFDSGYIDNSGFFARIRVPEHVREDHERHAARQQLADEGLVSQQTAVTSLGLEPATHMLDMLQMMDARLISQQQAMARLAAANGAVDFQINDSAGNRIQFDQGSPNGSYMANRVYLAGAGGRDPIELNRRNQFDTPENRLALAATPTSELLRRAEGMRGCHDPTTLDAMEFLQTLIRERQDAARDAVAEPDDHVGNVVAAVAEVDRIVDNHLARGNHTGIQTATAPLFPGMIQELTREGICEAMRSYTHYSDQSPNCIFMSRDDFRAIMRLTYDFPPTPIESGTYTFLGMRVCFETGRPRVSYNAGLNSEVTANCPAVDAPPSPRPEPMEPLRRLEF